MRIALVSTPFVSVPPPAYGGTELVVHSLSRSLERAGHAVTVFATGDSRASDLRATFPTAVWPPDPYAELLHARFAADEISRGAFDVVHAHVPALLAFADVLPAPVVYTLHHSVEPVLSRFYERVRSVRHVAISARQAELASPAPHHVVHHGLDPELYPVVGPGGDAAFFLGRLSWCKGPELAVEAARRAGMPLVMAGKPHRGDPCPEDWEADVLQPALRAAHVRWVREADLAQKRRLFARSRALLVPLRWEEPFGLVLVEAMLAGCPVITFPLGAAPEIVEDGVTGFLVRGVPEMAAALRRASALDRREIQARARARFSADRMARDYVAVYRAAIAGRRREIDAEAEEGGWTTLAQ
ncbi:glycosyltransferase family 4 protein [Anaeromyxobacter oryzae]|uniref:Glycosyl transferase n=1 Tax=Anaeromyxobacter oryzae TaxID=2918170 RepID=A0ABN6MYE4_9BACT|nr:glycosyltransferase family 4 protein [Anaeromyxobacter oryzae]BDG05916.1 glycosyl transferase [Anaeromyxobacter oryzae]